MTSQLIISQDKLKRESQAFDICKKNRIDSFDIVILDKDTKADKKRSTLSIGIDDIKLMQKKIFLKPLRSKQKAIIIKDAQLLTIEAQNAMLKILEEPPEHTIIILTAENKQSLLPTIFSRCQIIDLQTQKTLTAGEREELGKTLSQLQTLSINYSLKLAETLSKNKEETILWLEKMILLTREKLLALAVDSSINNSQLILNSQLISSLQQTHTLLKTTNVNSRIALEILFLNLSL